KTKKKVRLFLASIPCMLFIFFRSLSHDSKQTLRKFVQTACSRPSSGIVKGATLNLGFRAVPQLLFSFFARCLRQRAKKGKEVLRGHSVPRQRATPFAILFWDGRSKNLPGLDKGLEQPLLVGTAVAGPLNNLGAVGGFGVIHIGEIATVAVDQC